jgi:steroid 5-alpha reductase family enzyme
MGAILCSFCVALFLNTVGWLVSSLLSTDKLYDLIGSLSFLSCVLCARLLGSSELRATARAVAAAWMLGLWASRLGAFLFLRVLRSPDERLQRFVNDPLGFLLPFAFQTLWAFVGALPVLCVHSWGAPLPLSLAEQLIALAWAACAALQALADEQKRAFRAVRANRSRFIATGLWRFSRHPNYFFQICASWLLAAFCFRSLAAASWFGYVVALCPALETALILHVSGVPMLERAGRKKWGDQHEYKAYCAGTSCLVPWPPNTGAQKRRA